MKFSFLLTSSWISPRPPTYWNLPEPVTSPLGPWFPGTFVFFFLEFFTLSFWCSTSSRSCLGKDAWELKLWEPGCLEVLYSSCPHTCGRVWAPFCSSVSHLPVLLLKPLYVIVFSLRIEIFSVKFKTPSMVMSFWVCFYLMSCPHFGLLSSMLSIFLDLLLWFLPIHFLSLELNYWTFWIDTLIFLGFPFSFWKTFSTLSSSPSVEFFSFYFEELFLVLPVPILYSPVFVPWI